MNNRSFRQWRSYSAMVALLVVIAACSGSGGQVHTPTPTRTVRINPTPVPSRVVPPVEAGFGQFSMSSADTSRPRDILETVFLFMGGGAPFCNALRPGQPQVNWGAPSYNVVPVTLTEESTEEILISSCGWQSPGRLPVHVRYPDGTTRTLYTNVTPMQDGGLWAMIDIDLGSSPPAGTYTVTFDGRSGSATHTFELIRPTLPIVYTLNGGDVLLRNFQPFETVYLVAYVDSEDPNVRSGQFAAIKEYVTDQDGELYVQVTGSFAAFVALGERSGEVSEYGTFREVMGSILK